VALFLTAFLCCAFLCLDLQRLVPMGAILVIVLYPLIAYSVGMTFVLIAVRAVGGSSAWGTALAAPFSGKHKQDTQMQEAIAVGRFRPGALPWLQVGTGAPYLQELGVHYGIQALKVARLSSSCICYVTAGVWAGRGSHCVHIRCHWTLSLCWSGCVPSMLECCSNVALTAQGNYQYARSQLHVCPLISGCMYTCTLYTPHPQACPAPSWSPGL
jgi:hypothetical protein